MPAPPRCEHVCIVSQRCEANHEGKRAPELICCEGEDVLVECLHQYVNASRQVARFNSTNQDVVIARLSAKGRGEVVADHEGGGAWCVGAREEGQVRAAAGERMR